MSQFRRASTSQDKGKGGPLNDLQQSASITEQETRPIPVPILHPQTNLAQSPHPSITEQETLQLPATYALANPSRRSPKVAQGLLGTILSRAREPQPERWAHTWQQAAETPQARILGQFPMLLFIDALGIVMVTFARTYCATYACRSTSISLARFPLGLWSFVSTHAFANRITCGACLDSLFCWPFCLFSTRDT